VIQEQPRYPTPGRKALEAAGVPVLATPPPAEIDPVRAIVHLLDWIEEDPPEAVLVWKGRQGRGFIVSDRRETGALAHLRKRSLGLIAGGVAVLCFGLYEVIQLFSDGGPS